MKRKRSKVWLFAWLLWPVVLRATPDISMEVCRYVAGEEPYIEVSLYVVGRSLASDSLGQKEYGITYILMVKNAAGEVVAGNRYKLSAAGHPAKDILDVRRFSIPPGQYSVSLEASDILDSLSTMEVRQDIDVPSDIASIQLSDLQLVAAIRPEQPGTPTLNKSGMSLEPLPFRFFYPALQMLYLYHETYHTDLLEGQPYMQYTVKPLQGDVPPAIVSYRKVKKEPVSPQLFLLQINTLISGPYVLEAKLFDGNRQEKASAEIRFSRLNPRADSLYMESSALQVEGSFVDAIPEDSLEYCMRAMAPIISSIDNDVMNMLLQKGSAKAKRYFIHRYWTNTAGKSADIAYHAYMKVAHAVDDNYRSGFGYGFETDRGHIFLKYGRPDDIISIEDEPSAPPYEIWFYSTFPATHQANVRFLFYNPSLAKNAYKLLHSTAIGEVRNERWEIELYRDATLETPGVNAKELGPNVYRNARKYFDH